ncbi:hypothetical protein N9T26_01100 [Alphaproteobacteria bacterium]|nr:hypothetical protein [Alphaproteobacteria bacterium]
MARDITSPVHRNFARSVAPIAPIIGFYRFGVPQACITNAVISK